MIKPENIAVDYVNAVYAGDLETFKTLTLPESYTLEASEDYYLFVTGKSTARMLTAIQRKGVNEIVIEKVKIYPSDGKVTIKVRFNNEQVKRVSLPLIKVNERWYVEATHWRYW
ncbi:MAG: DUF4878 domain-containing protein [Pseudomonadota bacterium]